MMGMLVSAMDHDMVRIVLRGGGAVTMNGMQWLDVRDRLSILEDVVPKTADGVVVKIGSEVFWNAGPLLRVDGLRQYDDGEWWLHFADCAVAAKADDCYSTREAADAAAAAMAREAAEKASEGGTE